MRTRTLLSAVAISAAAVTSVAVARDAAPQALLQAAQSPGVTSQPPTGVEHPELPLEERLQQGVEQIKIDEIVTIPIRSLKAIYSEGQITYLSDNGRYAIRGELIDVWQHKTLDTIGQVRDSVERLRFDNMGMPITDLNTLTLKSDKADAPVVNIFVDPKHAPSRKIIGQARALTRDYTFNFIVVPAINDGSVEPAKKISCAADRAAALSAIERDAIEHLQVSANCDLKTFTQTLVAADLMGVNGVPFIVAPGGAIGRGRPDDLGAWLQEHKHE